MTRAGCVLVLVFAALVVAVGGTAGAIPNPTADSEPPPGVQTAEGKLVEVRSGVATLADLIRTRSVTKVGGVYVLHRPVNVLPGATLELSDASLRLVGGVMPATIRVGGVLTVQRVRLSAGDGPRADRPEIAVRAGGSLRLESSQVEGLGANEDHPGIEVRGALARATIVDTTIRRNFRGFVASDADRVAMRGSTIAGNLDSGVVVNGACASIVIRDTVASQNKGDGFAFNAGCDSVSVNGGGADRNGQSGIDAGGTTNVKINAFDAWGNASGITTHDSAIVAVAGAQLSANHLDGITMNALSGGLSVVRSRIDHNVRSGISVSDGKTVVGPGNVITGNDTGVRLVDGTATVKAEGNAIEHNVRDGVSLSSVTGVEITNNRIVANGDAGFSVRQQGDAASFVADNTVRSSPVKERLRSADAAEAS